MSLTVPQLEELQTIAETIQDQFTENQDDSWWAAIRILNAGLGPSAGGSTFQDTLDDIKVTQGQIRPYQSRVGGRNQGFREAVLQVVPTGGGSGDNYYSADLVGSTARTHTHNGRDAVVENYLDAPETATYSKGPSLASELVTDGTNVVSRQIDAVNNRAQMLSTNATNGDAEVAVQDGVIELNSEEQRITITQPFGGDVGLQEFDDIADAQSGGLSDGDLFYTSGNGSAPLDAQGIVMIVVQGA